MIDLDQRRARARARKRLIRILQDIFDSRRKEHLHGVAWLGSTSFEEGSFRELCSVLGLSCAEVQRKVADVREGRRVRPRTRERLEKEFLKDRKTPKRHLRLVM